MQRRKFLTTAAVGGLTLSSTSALGQANSKTRSRRNRWRLVMAIPKTLPIWGPGIERFAKNVNTMSQGEIDIRVYGAGEMVPALQVFDAVKSGRVQMGHAASYYWQGMLPAAPFFTCAPFGLDPAGMRAWLKSGAQDLWDELYQPHGVFALPCGNTGMQMGGWFNKEINSMRDFRGLKMRIPGIAGSVIEKAGGQPMLVAGGDIFTNLTTGVIDATEWVGPYHDYVLGLHRAAKFYYYPGWHEPGPVLELIINRKAWNELSDDLKQIITSAAAEADRDIHAEWLVKDAEYLEKISQLKDVRIKPFPDEVLKSLQQLSQEVSEEVAKTSPLAKKIHESHQTFIKSYHELQKVTQWAYAKTLSKT